MTGKGCQQINRVMHGGDQVMRTDGGSRTMLRQLATARSVLFYFILPRIVLGSLSLSLRPLFWIHVRCVGLSSLRGRIVSLSSRSAGVMVASRACVQNGEVTAALGDAPTCLCLPVLNGNA